MPRRWKIFISGTVCLTLCLSALWYASIPPRVFRRTYEGKNLESWLKEFYANPSGSPHAREAIRTLCTNDLPALVAALDYDPAPWEAKVKLIRPFAHNWFPAQVEIWLCADSRNNRSLIAANALSTIERDAGPAVPLLKGLTNSSNVNSAWNALLLLPRLGSNGQNHVVAMMADEKNPYRLRALEAVKINADFFQPSANPAAFPALAVCMRSKDPALALAAVRMMSEVGPLEPDIGIPALGAASTNSDASVRWWSIAALAVYSERADDCIPPLTRALKDPDPGVREAATNQLNRIRGVAKQ